eukprot:527246-Pleurochrysis_carterae.AAC.1
MGNRVVPDGTNDCSSKAGRPTDCAYYPVQMGALPDPCLLRGGWKAHSVGSVARKAMGSSSAISETGAR